VKQYLPLFRNRNFLLLWLGGAISNIGDFFNSVALVKVLSADQAHFGFLLAAVLVAKMLPGVLLAPVAGVVADRLPRRTIMVVCDVLRAVLVLGLVVTDHPVVILALVFLAASVAAFHNPAASALLPNLVTQEQLVTAGSLAVMTQRMAQLLGNGIGAAVLGWLGAHNVFYIDAASFVVSALLVSAMVLPAGAAASAPAQSESSGEGVVATQGESSGEGAAPAQATARSFKGDVKEALSFLRNTAPVRHLFVAFGIAAVGDSAMNVLMTTFFTAALGLAVEHLGYVWAAFGGASVLGALAIGALGNRIHWRTLISFGAVYVYATNMAALASGQALLATVFITLLGLGSGAINVGAQAAVGTLVPDQVRGRIFSAFGMMQSLIFVIFSMTAGALSDHLGPTIVLMIFSTPYLLAGLYTFFAFRKTVATTEATAPSAPAAK
jgi:MFS family permease